MLSILMLVTMADSTETPSTSQLSDTLINTPIDTPFNQNLTPYMPTASEHLLTFNIQARLDARDVQSAQEMLDLHSQKLHIFTTISHRYRQEFFYRNECQNCHELPGQPPGAATSHVRMRPRLSWCVLQEIDHMYVPGEVLFILIKALSQRFIAAESTYMFEAKQTKCADGMGMYRARI